MASLCASSAITSISSPSCFQIACVWALWQQIPIDQSGSLRWIPGWVVVRPTGWGSGSPAKLKELRTKENNYVGSDGAWFQNKFTRRTGPIDNLFAHLADPGHATIFATFTPK
ncbi:hypothetical protein Rs2_23132 [Raphanus sativus]|nr:hypothetical protein Rs2_23132 [Raphanus sativus]